MRRLFFRNGRHMTLIPKTWLMGLLEASEIVPAPLATSSNQRWRGQQPLRHAAFGLNKL